VAHGFSLGCTHLGCLLDFQRRSGGPSSNLPDMAISPHGLADTWA
jgi:hypothetical protein